MCKLVVYNHEYHISDDSVKLEWDKLVKVNGFEQSSRDDLADEFTIIESGKIWNIVFLRILYSFRISSHVENSKEVVIFGGQDYISCKIARRAINLGKKVTVVPDNIEFYLRPGSFVTNKSIKASIRAILLGFRRKDLGKKYDVFDNRMVFQLPSEAEIDPFLGFYSSQSKDLKEKKRKKRNRITYISQPYYLDYGIDLRYWNEKLLLAFQHYTSRGYEVSVKLHHRDSSEFKEFIESERCNLVQSFEAGDQYFGLFSTLLFQLSCQGAMVYSIFNIFKEMFPSNYVNFVEEMANNLELNLEGELPWLLVQSKFDKLNQSVLSSQ